MKGPAHWLTVSVLVFSALLFVDAKIHQSNVENDDRRLIPLTDAFGYGKTGQLDITLSDIRIYTPHDSEDTVDFGDFGFFLSPLDADVALDQELLDQTKCILDDDNLFTFKDTSVRNVLKNETKSFNHTFPISPEGGVFYLYFANCAKLTPISFKAHIEMYNIDSHGNKDFLSIGDTNLDVLYWVMCAFFTFGTAFWGYVVWINKETSHKVHYLMFSLGLFKSLTLFTEAFTYYMVESTGYAEGWNVAFYIFTFCRGILFFTVIVLVGTGWSYMKPFLGDKEKKILMVVIPLQVFANIAIVITEEESPSAEDWFTWRDIFHLVDIICCCAVLFPIVWSIKNLRDAAQTDGKAARNLEKLTLFRQFYVMVVVYIYFTRIVVYLLKNTVEYEYSWVSDAADEVATLAFYLWTASKFRPHKENPYLKVHSDEVDP